MSTFHEVREAQEPAIAFLASLGIEAAVGITRAGLSDAILEGKVEEWQKNATDAEDATDYILAVRIQNETTAELPETINGIPAEYEFIGIIELE